MPLPTDRTDAALSALPLVPRVAAVLAFSLAVLGLASTSGAPEAPAVAHFLCPSLKAGDRLTAATLATSMAAAPATAIASSDTGAVDGHAYVPDHCEAGFLTLAAAVPASAWAAPHDGFQGVQLRLADVRLGLIELRMGAVVVVSGVRVLAIDGHVFPNDEAGNPVVFAGEASAIVEVPDTALDVVRTCRDVGRLEAFPVVRPWQPSDPLPNCALLQQARPGLVEHPVGASFVRTQGIYTLLAGTTPIVTGARALRAVHDVAFFEVPEGAPALLANCIAQARTIIAVEAPSTSVPRIAGSCAAAPPPSARHSGVAAIPHY